MAAEKFTTSEDIRFQQCINISLQVVPILHPSSLGSSDASYSLEIEVKRTEQQVKTLQNSVVIPLMKSEFSLETVSTLM